MERKKKKKGFFCILCPSSCSSACIQPRSSLRWATGRRGRGSDQPRKERLPPPYSVSYKLEAAGATATALLPPSLPPGSGCGGGWRRGERDPLRRRTRKKKKSWRRSLPPSMCVVVRIERRLTNGRTDGRGGRPPVDTLPLSTHSNADGHGIKDFFFSPWSLLAKNAVFGECPRRRHRCKEGRVRCTYLQPDKACLPEGHLLLSFFLCCPSFFFLLVSCRRLQRRTPFGGLRAREGLWNFRGYFRGLPP